MIYDVIKKALIEKLGMEDDEVSPEAYIKDDLELDSTETVIIALELKKAFGVDYTFPDDDVQVKDIVSSVEKDAAVTA